MPADAIRAAVEELLYHEAALLDEWRLEEWLALLTEDCRYLVPSNDRLEADPARTLFTIADDIHRIRARVTRLNDRRAHAESPRSRTRRLIGNVRILSSDETQIEAQSNFIVHRFRREGDVRQYVGRYRHVLRREAGKLKIARREVLLDAFELGTLGAVSFIL